MKVDLTLHGELPPGANVALLRESLEHVFACFGGHLNKMNVPRVPASGSLVAIVSIPRCESLAVEYQPHRSALTSGDSP
jgi:hypothetical protein